MALDPRRDTDVTASDVPAICGECPFQTPRSVLFKKVTRIRNPDTPATLHGRKFEIIALRRFCETSKATVVEYPCGYKRHGTYVWLGGTEDAKVKLSDGTVVVVEIKCPISRAIKDEVPVHYVGQVQTYLYLEPECPYALFVQYKPAGPRSLEKLQVTRVDRDPRYMDLRLPVLKRFWDDLQMQTAYMERVATVLQRAWRARGTVRMENRLKCARIVGRMAGAARLESASVGMGSPPMARADTGDVTDSVIYPPQAKRLRTGGHCFIID